MWLLAETIRRLFQYQDDPPNRFHAIVVGCTYCKSLETYTLHKDFPGHNPKDTVIFAPPQYGDVVHLRSLECDAENCGTLLPVIALFHPNAPVEVRKDIVDAWTWENLVCPQGHPILRQNLY